MKKINTFVALSLIGVSHISSADNFKKKCSDLAQCLESVGQITGKKYIYHPDFAQKKIASTENLEINSANAEILLTKALDLHGFTRIETGSDQTYEIVESKHVNRNAPIKINASVDQPPHLVDTWDYYTLVYKYKNTKKMKGAVRVIQDFLPRSGHAVEFPESNLMMVTAPAPVLKRVYHLLVDIDQANSLSHLSPPKLPNNPDNIKTAFNF